MILRNPMMKMGILFGAVSVTLKVEKLIGGESTLLKSREKN